MPNNTIFVRVDCASAQELVQKLLLRKSSTHLVCSASQFALQLNLTRLPHKRGLVHVGLLDLAGRFWHFSGPDGSNRRCLNLSAWWTVHTMPTASAYEGVHTHTTP